MDLDLLLERTSRTFALAIPLLPPPLRREVSVAYLVFRVLDTLEDAYQWPVAERQQALRDMVALLDAPEERVARSLGEGWLLREVSSHAGYRALVADLPGLVGAFSTLPGPVAACITRAARTTGEGMGSFLARTDGTPLATLDDLRAYCFVVAGVVGEMLTELFLRHTPLLHADASLRARAAAFGEGLQLVNVLKDASTDAREGRHYLPASVPAALIFAQARQDLDEAAEYVAELRRGGAHPGIVAFTSLPLELARATLALVEQRGPGARLTRGEVAAICVRVAPG